MPRVSTYFETPPNAIIRHLVIGHSQVRHVWDHNPDNNISIDWISVSGGHSHELAQMIKTEINESAIPLYISGLIWQNDVTTLTIASACAIIQDLEQFMMDYPYCKLALPEVKLYHFIIHLSPIQLLLIDYPSLLINSSSKSYNK